jgi:hypothetical protein
MDNLVKIISAPVVVLSVLLDVRSVLSGLFALEVIRVFLVPLLLKLIIRNLSVSVHTIAARRTMEDLAATLCASMMTAALVVEADAGGSTLLLIRVGCRCLHISSITEHRHLDTNFGNTLVLLVIVD